MQEAWKTQGLPVQEGQGLPREARKEKVRCQAERLWRSDEAHFQKEGKDHKEDHPQAWVCRLQEKKNDSP